LVTLNPNSVSNLPANKESAINEKNEEKKSKPDVAPIGDVESSRRTQERKYAVISLCAINVPVFSQLI